MFYTSKIQQAIKFATKVHIGQKRKGKEDPYIMHPLSVGLILSRAGATEDQVVAGILHDTIEDCDPHGSVTKELLEIEFGSDVARIVNDVSEQDKSLPWPERKRAALDHVKEMQNDSVMVKSADVLHNLSDQIADFVEKGDEMFDSFNAKKLQQLDRYKNLLSELEKAYPQNPLLSELREAVRMIKEIWI